MEIVSKVCWIIEKKNGGHIEKIYCFISILLFCNFLKKIESFIIIQEYSYFFTL